MKLKTAGRLIWCCGCDAEVLARFTTGLEIYPHRFDLRQQPFWRCDTCGNYVGCHHKHHDPVARRNPLGNIPTPEMRNARKHIHALLDPIWKRKLLSRGYLYAALTEHLGHQYHTAELRTLEEARSVYRKVQEIVSTIDERKQNVC